MRKEIISAVVVFGKVFDVVTDIAVIGGGSYIAYDAIAKRYNPQVLKKAANLAFENGLKEGDVQEIIRVDRGIPLIAKRFYANVALYVVVKINNDGKYKMRYVGSRGITKEEVENTIEFVK